MATASTPADITHHDSAPPANPYSIPSSAMPLISPHSLLYTSLSQTPSIRPSNRKPTQCRPISINTSSLTHANGSSLIKIGQTTAVCGVRAEILPIHEIASYRVNKKQWSQTPRPAADEQSDDDGSEADTVIRTHNLLVPNLDLSTGCSPFHLPGSPPSQEAQSLSQRLLSLLHSSRFIRLSDLCIHAPDLEHEISSTGTPPEKELKAFWVLYIDTVIINHDGNLFDACALAMFSALRDTLLPKAWWDPDLASVMCSPERDQARALRLRGCPVPLSFVVFRSNKLEEGGMEEKKKVRQVLCDADAFEEGCCREVGCVVVDLDRMGRVVVIRVEKSGGGSLGGEGLKDLVERAGERWREWQEILGREMESKAKAR